MHVKMADGIAKLSEMCDSAMLLKNIWGMLPLQCSSSFGVISELVSQWVCNLNAIGLREKRVGIKDMGAIDKSEVPCTLIGPINFQ